MTTESDNDWRPVAELDGCTFSAYEASGELGRVRSVDRVRAGRQLRGVVLKPRPNNSGYLLINMSCDTRGHRPHTYTLHKVILTTFAGPCPPGQEALHGPGGPTDNRWPASGLKWGTKPENAETNPSCQAPIEPSHPCRNAPRCANLVVKPGRRCMDCVAEQGRQAAAMLDAGVNLNDVATHFGNTQEWVFKLAVQHGGYTGTRAQAREQQPSRSQRVLLRFRRRSMLRQAGNAPLPPGGDVA